MHIPEPAFSTFNASQKKEAQEIKDIFEKSMQAEEFVSEFRLVQVEVSSANERMIESARAADLLSMTHEDTAHDSAEQRHAQQCRELRLPVTPSQSKVRTDKDRSSNKVRHHIDLDQFVFSPFGHTRHGLGQSGLAHDT